MYNALASGELSAQGDPQVVPDPSAEGKQEHFFSTAHRCHHSRYRLPYAPLPGFGQE